MKRYTLIICLILSVAGNLLADRAVVDMPELHLRHLRLLSLMNSSHERQDYYAMEGITHQGISLGTCDNLWTYNLACALSLQGNCNESLDRLQEAIDLGFEDLEHIKGDPDLRALHHLPRFAEILAALQSKLDDPDYRNPKLKKIIALPPDATRNVYQSATNTLWNFSTAFFHTFMILKEISPTNATAYAGIGATQINALKSGTPTNSMPRIIYVNRDNDAHTVATDKYPGVMRLKYSADFRERNLHTGQPNTLFFNAGSGHLIPAVGSSSMGFISAAYWRCLPRALFNDQFLMQNQITLLMSNQLFCYPAHSDYNLITGDLFPANTPYYIAVTGSAESEKVFVEAIIAAISALRADTREYLTRKGLLMSTIQILLRQSQQEIHSRQDYLSGIAHPAAFQISQLNIEKLINAAAAMTTNRIPPLVFIRTEDQTALNPRLDMPDRIYSERLFDTHLAAARVFRGYPYKRQFRITAFCSDKDAAMQCVILQGDPRKISIQKNPENQNEWLIELAYHAPFMTPVAGGKSVLTPRIDIGLFAENSSGISLPAIFSCAFPGNEKRIYDQDGKLISIDYRRHTTPYTDPLLSTPRNWKDEFRHDKRGRIIGWTRIRARKREQFTAYGDLALKFDDKGRPTLARRIAYVPRFIGNREIDADSLPSLAQVDDSIEVRYRYASDDDMIGQPDLEADSGLMPAAHD